MPSVQIVEVTPAEAGQKLLQFLERRLDREVPRAALMRWIRTGQVRVDGRRSKPFDRIEAGQAVRIPPYEIGKEIRERREAAGLPPQAGGPEGQCATSRSTEASDPLAEGGDPLWNPHQVEGGKGAPAGQDVSRRSPHFPSQLGCPEGVTPSGGEGSRGEAKPLPWPPEALGFPVVHQDEELLVLAKPAGLPTQPGSGWTDSVSTRLKRLGGDFATTPVHRLDKDTSGLLLAARTYGCLRRLQDLFKGRLAGKIYLAWVAGRLTPGVALVLRDVLAKSGPAGRERVRAGAEAGTGSGGGKEALAEALPLLVREVRPGAGSEATLVAVRLLTGRTHQIRVQLASRDHAVIGDRKYGGLSHDRLLLHAWRLDLPERTFELLPDWTGEWEAREEDLEAAQAWAGSPPTARRG